MSDDAWAPSQGCHPFIIVLHPKSLDVYELQLTHIHQGLSMLLGARIAYKLMISPTLQTSSHRVGHGEVGTWHPK